MGMFELALIAVGAVFGVSIVASLFSRPTAEQGGEGGILSGYLLANGRLSSVSLISLLLSTSFGLNTMFYQGWLGYRVGVWGIVIQAFWGLSFWWLAKYAVGVRSSKSLHDFLAQKYGALARVTGAICSITGFVFLMGWELDICRNMFTGFLSRPDQTVDPSAMSTAGWLAAAAAIGALLYTLHGGLRGNAAADFIQNGIKAFALLVLMAVLFNIDKIPTPQFLVWNKMIVNLGLIGLLTNIVFSICWQFVDASTWQSVEASAQCRTPEETVHDLRMSGLAAFIIPGIFGTLVGVALSGIPQITEASFFSSIVQFAGASNWIVFLFLFAAVAAVMSLVDGLLLASAYAMVVDLARPQSSLGELDSKETTAAAMVAAVRLCLVFNAGCGLGNTCYRGEVS